MSEDKKKSYVLNLGFLNTVGIVFIVLKLLSIEPVNSWSWIWVLCPFWIQFVIVFGILLLFGLCAVAVAILQSSLKK